MTTTNSISPVLAANLAAARKGTFTSLIIRKEGEERGPAGAKTVYGDDLVQVVVVTGFRYENLVARSRDQLASMTDAEVDALVARGYTGWSGRGKNAVEVPVTRADFDAARMELTDSFDRTLAGTNESTTDHVYEPLVVNGEVVRGSRVYTGNPNGTDAATPGTVYLQGLKIGERVLDAAPNGPVPASQSAAKTVAKNVLRSRLPVARYVSYKLDTSTPGAWLLSAGGAAAAACDTNGVTLDADRVNAAVEALVG
jgi:hypothetical protein